MADRLVVGRVVSLEGGRPMIAVPPGPEPTGQTSAHAHQVGALIKAARDYKARQNKDTIAALCSAARALE